MTGRMSVIGVACEAGEESLAREFFELFKTPWEFYRADQNYSVVISTRTDLLHAQADLLVLYGSKQAGQMERPSNGPVGVENTYLSYRDVRFPIYGKVLTFSAAHLVLARVESTSRAAAVEISHSPVQVLRVGYDLFQEVRVLLSSGQPLCNAFIPTLDIHIAMLRDWIVAAGIPFVEIPPVPVGYEFIGCLTHDVDFIRIRDHKLDHTAMGFIWRASIGSLLKFAKRQMSASHLFSNIKALLSLPAIYLGLCKDFWYQDFEKFLSIERDLKSTFFFIPFKHRPGENVSRLYAKRRAAVYDVREERGLLEQIAGMGHEIGVHGIDAWHDASKGRQERRQLADITGQENLGVRIHWLCFDAASPRVLEEAGFQYDSTFGYNETVGFRAGTLQVFRPAEAKTLLELPLHIQDTALFYSGYLGLRESRAWKLCEILLKNAQTYGGVLTVLWHTRSLAPERLWGDFYLRLLRALRARPVWFAPARQVVDWFRKRRALSFRQIDFAGRRVRLIMDNEGRTDAGGTPNVFVRIYTPRPGPITAGHFVDVPWTGDAVMDISVG